MPRARADNFLVRSRVISSTSDRGGIQFSPRIRFATTTPTRNASVGQECTCAVADACCSERRYAQRREAARRRERDDTAAALALSRVTSGQSTSRSVRRPPPYSGAAPPPPPPPPNPFRATPSSRGESSYARRERLSRQMDL